MGRSFENAFEAEFASLHRYLARRLGSSAADELAAETFAVAFRNWSHLDPARPVRPWLYGIAANLVRHHWRKERRMLRAYARTGIDPVFAEDDAAVERGCRRAAAGARGGDRGASPGPARAPPAPRLGGVDRFGDRRRTRPAHRDGQVAALAHARAATEPTRRGRARSSECQMMDELLHTFRSEVAEPDRETAALIYALATRSVTPRRRYVFRLRPRLVLAGVVAALVLVPTGVAFGGKLAGLFEGTPAPPDVSTNFTNFNRMADLPVQQGFAQEWPHADVSKAHGVIEVLTPDGPEDMWAAPNDQGGQCYFIDFANDPPGNDGMYGFGGCESSTSLTEKIDYGDVWTYVHPDLMTVYGSVHVDAATVRLTLDDGSTATLPVVEHLFLGSTAKGVKVDAVTALDTGGNQVAEKTLRPGAPTRG